MSAKEQIGRLQSLLERVQTRALEARAGGAAFAPVAPAPTPGFAATTPTPTPASVEVDHDSLPPDTAHGGGQEAYFDDGDADVEVSSETVEVDIDIDEPMPMESGAQPIAQQTMPPEDLEEEVDERPIETDPSIPAPAHEGVAHEEVAHAAPPANEIEEPTPSSSRRPIAGEEITAYGDESAPRHTPPPESGKQIAAPSVHPAAARAPSEPSINPSVPPPSLEGHTLVGGWREPGLGPSAPGAAGVRVPAPPPAAGAPPPVAASASQASGTRLTADVTRPELSATANVARIEGTAPVATPTTLGELLDLTLAL